VSAGVKVPRTPGQEVAARRPLRPIRRRLAPDAGRGGRQGRGRRAAAANAFAVAVVVGVRPLLRFQLDAAPGRSGRRPLKGIPEAGAGAGAVVFGRLDGAVGGKGRAPDRMERAVEAALRVSA